MASANPGSCLRTGRCAQETPHWLPHWNRAAEVRVSWLPVSPGCLCSGKCGFEPAGFITGLPLPNAPEQCHHIMSHFSVSNLSLPSLGLTLIPLSLPSRPARSSVDTIALCS